MFAKDVWKYIVAINLNYRSIFLRALKNRGLIVDETMDEFHTKWKDRFRNAFNLNIEYVKSLKYQVILWNSDGIIDREFYRNHKDELENMSLNDE